MKPSQEELENRLAILDKEVVILAESILQESEEGLSRLDPMLIIEQFLINPDSAENLKQAKRFLALVHATAVLDDIDPALTKQ